MSKRDKRRAGSRLDRAGADRDERPTILIVCEGENTEPSYFKQFRLVTLKIRVEGLGTNTLDLVNRAIELRNSSDFDQIWAVFDKDSFSAASFNGAIQKARSNGIYVAYSNQSFEYWLLLHLIDHQGGGLHRRNYNDEINRRIKPLGLEYDVNGSKIIEEDFYNYLMSIDPTRNIRRVDIAIQRANHVLEYHKDNTPSDSESSTTVHHLVEVLLKHVS